MRLVADEKYIFRTVEETLKRLGYPGLLPYIVYRWSNRRLMCNGAESIAMADASGRIHFSVREWKTLSRAEREFVVQHEVCHLVDMLRHSFESLAQYKGHGPSWRYLMTKCSADYSCAP